MNGNMSSREILKAMKDALHDLETTQGLWARDRLDATGWRLDHRSIANLIQAIDQYESEIKRKETNS